MNKFYCMVEESMPVLVDPYEIAISSSELKKALMSVHEDCQCRIFVPGSNLYRQITDSYACNLRYSTEQSSLKISEIILVIEVAESILGKSYRVGFQDIDKKLDGSNRKLTHIEIIPGRWHKDLQLPGYIDLHLGHLSA